MLSLPPLASNVLAVQIDKRFDMYLEFLTKRVLTEDSRQRLACFGASKQTDGNQPKRDVSQPSSTFSSAFAGGFCCAINRPVLL